jgi:hypothetical protein
VPSTAARWPARVLAGLTASALVLPLGAVPQVRDLALREVALAVDLAAPELRTRAYVAERPPARAVTAPAPVLVWGDSILVPSGPAAAGRGLPRAAAPQRPAPPAPPALRPVRARATTEPTTPVRLGPVLRLRRQVARGAPITLPAGVGSAHILCDGGGGQRARYWLDSTGGATEVRRRDGSGYYDFSYRWVTGGSYQQRAACR